MNIVVNQTNQSGANYMNGEINKMKKNLLEVTHVTNDGIFHDLIFDLDVIKISCIGNHPLEKYVIIYWYIPGVTTNSENATNVSDSYESLKERIFGVKE